MNNNEFKKLVAAMRNDPSLLHALAFETKNATQKVAFLPETERTVLTGLQAENLLAHAFGLLEKEEEPLSNTAVAAAGIEVGRIREGLYGHINPGDLNAGCGGDTTCSCTSGTCGGATCGGSTCSVTCSGDSCGNTCGDSCSNTSNYAFDPLEQERLLARQFNQTLVWK